MQGGFLEQVGGESMGAEREGLGIKNGAGPHRRGEGGDGGETGGAWLAGLRSGGGGPGGFPAGAGSPG